MKKRLSFFDLDGTLLNTIADLAVATNYALTQFGYPTHDTDAYRFSWETASTNCSKELFLNRKEHRRMLCIRSKFVPYYNLHNADLSRPYPGIEKLLAQLQEQHIQVAVAPTSIRGSDRKLIRQYFPIHFTAVFGQRENVPTKPTHKSFMRLWK